MAKFCFRSNEINSFFFFTFINSGKSVSKPDLLTNAAYELFKAEFNLYLVYGNYINAHLSDLKFMREMSQSFLPEFEMFNRTTVSCNRSFIDPKVDTALINRILNVIHSTFNIQQTSKAEQQIDFVQFKEHIEAKQLHDQEVVFLFVAFMRAVGADVSLTCNFSGKGRNTVFWAEVFLDGKWTPVEPLSRAIGSMVILLENSHIVKYLTLRQCYLQHNRMMDSYRNRLTMYSFGKPIKKSRTSPISMQLNASDRITHGFLTVCWT